LKVPLVGELVSGSRTFDAFDMYLGTKIDSLTSMEPRDVDLGVSEAACSLAGMSKLASFGSTRNNSSRRGRAAEKEERASPDVTSVPIPPCRH